MKLSNFIGYVMKFYSLAKNYAVNFLTFCDTLSFATSFQIPICS